MKSASILIVEDEAIVALDLADRLRNAGYSIPAFAGSLEDAAQKVAEIRPDLVLMDTHLAGDMDGIEVAEVIHARFRTPVVYLTGHANVDSVLRPKQTEPPDQILKPFSKRKLRTATEMALHGHARERRLREREEWLATSLESIGDAVIATDAQGQITFMNSLAEGLTGWRRGRALGTVLTDVFITLDGETRTPAQGPLSSLLQVDATAGLKNGTLLVTKDGAQVPIDGSAAPIRDAQGNAAGIVLTFRDISERKQQEETLRQYAGDLEERLEELDTFTRMVAHDIKGLVAHIVGCAHVLDEYSTELSDEERDECLHVITRSGRKVSNVIDELLLITTTRQVGRAETTPVDMAQIVAEAQQRLDHVTEEYQGEIILPESWPEAMGYTSWVEEVWVNYISNALKYGGHPPRVELGSTAGDNGTVRFWVRDNGPGLTPQQQAQLFAPMTRLGQATVKGHGLGLSIVRRIVEQMGGQAGVESEVGRGSVFSFSLPVAASEVGIYGTPDMRRVLQAAERA